MGASFRQSMAWLHTWAGLIVGWVLFFIFVTGTVSYFQFEITRWMLPERPLATKRLAPEQAVEIADAYLRREAAGADRWLVGLPDSRSLFPLHISWPSRAGRRWERREYDVSCHRFHNLVQSRETAGGGALFKMHWRLHYVPIALGVWIVGACTMVMLIALLSGIVAHKKIFADFFTFRPRKGQRSWLDLHNVVSVMALPFFIMITFSGLAFWPSMYVPSAAHVLYGGHSEQLDDDSSVFLRPEARSGLPAPMLPLRDLLSAVGDHWPDGKAGRIEVLNPGDANAKVRFDRDGGPTLIRGVMQVLYFDAVNGKLILQSDLSTTQVITYGLYGLHEGKFAGWVLRWLYFASGLLGCAMIATGLVLWTVKRRAKHGSTSTTGFGFRLVECLNIGTIVGLPIGIAIYFWANRLLPVGMAARADWEMHSLFIAWGVMLLWASVRPASRAWVEELSVAAVAFASLPLLNAVTTDRHLGVTIPAGDWVLAGFDLTVLVTGVLFGIAAIKVHRKSRALTDPGRGRQSLAEVRP